MTGEELRQARRAARLSRRALAALAGLHPDSVRYWERKPRLDLHGHAPARMLKALGLGDLLRRSSFSAQYARGRAETAGEFPNNTRARDRLLHALEAIPCAREARQLVGPWKRCGARTRKGTPCRAKALPRKTRCKFHGGASTGPRTAKGRARVSEAQRKRWAAWRARRSLD
jgi:transcriptional regulator with XRE-family HTH domain